MSDGYFSQGWAFVILCVALGFFAFEIYQRRRWQWFSTLRLLWILALCFLIANWTQILSQKWSEPQPLTILIDQSDSVSKIPSRSSQIQDLIERLNVSKVPHSIYSFGSRIEAGADLSANARSATYLKPAQKLSEETEGPILLISDGRWWDQAEFRSPVYTLSSGGNSERDIWISKLAPVMTAFLKNRLKIPVELNQRGFDGKAVEVSLWRNGEEIEKQSVELSATGAQLELSLFPERMGEALYFVSVRPLAGEISTLNNRMPLRIRTVRDKIRVLHIGGKPSVDLRTWRLFLTHQPDVDLVSFYILREIQDDPEARQQDLSLIPFPYEDLFSKELDKFDVVILQNFDFNLYFSQSVYIANLAQFIRNGGSLLLFGGDQSLHRYRGSPLHDLLPIRFNGLGEFKTGEKRARVVSNHPVVKDLENAFLIPVWTGWHELQSNPGAMDLVRYDGGMPFLSIRPVDKGRVVVFNTDESWRLKTHPREEMAAFSRLARRVLQYLTFDPELEPPALQSETWKVGERVRLKLGSKENANWMIRSTLNEGKVWTFSNQNEIQFEVPFADVFEVKIPQLAEAFYFETEEQPWQNEWREILVDTEALLTLSQSSGGRFLQNMDGNILSELEKSGRQQIAAELKSWIDSDSIAIKFFLFFTILGICLDFFGRKKNNWDPS